MKLFLKIHSFIVFIFSLLNLTQSKILSNHFQEKDIIPKVRSLWIIDYDAYDLTPLNRPDNANL